MNSRMPNLAGHKYVLMVDEAQWMDDVEVLKALRADARFQATPIIMLTSEADVDAVSETLAFQVNAYLLKDKPREIMKRLREYLG